MTVVASVLKLTSLRHMSRLYDLIGAATGGVPLRPLLELAARAPPRRRRSTRWSASAAPARVAMETALRRRLFVALLTEDMAALERRTAGECRERLGGEASRVADVVARALTGGVKSCATAVHGVAATRLSWEISAVALGMVPPGVLLFGVVGAFSAKAHRDAAAAKEAAASRRSPSVPRRRAHRARHRARRRRRRAYAEALRVAARPREVARDPRARRAPGFVRRRSEHRRRGVAWYGGQLVQQGRLTVASSPPWCRRAGQGAGAARGAARAERGGAEGAHAADNAARVLNAEQKVETRVRRRMEARLDARHDSAPARHDSARRVRRVQRRRLASRIERERDDAVAAGDDRPRLALISFRDVRFAYPGRPEREGCMRGFEDDLKPGETFALVGPSGGGKSTVGALLSRWGDPTAGARGGRPRAQDAGRLVAQGEHRHGEPRRDAVRRHDR